MGIETNSMANKERKPLVMYGWQCPVCEAVMAPFVQGCNNCVGNSLLKVLTKPGFIVGSPQCGVESDGDLSAKDF